MASGDHKEATANVKPVKDDSKQVSAGSSSETLPVAAPKRVKDISEGAFDTSEDPRYYKPIDDYEGIHRWDPDFEWGEQEEKKLIRKIDLRVCTFACITFFALQLDRGNIVQAMSDNMLGDLGMNTNDYNTGQTIFYLVFLFAELPSQLISKKIGPDRWIPIQMFCWSLIAAFQAFLSGKKSYYVCRALLALFEGGFIPDTILFLSFWYKSKELPIRLSYFWVSYEGTSIISAFLAYGFLHVRRPDGTGGWRYLFAFEGLITGIIAIIAAFWMPASPTQTKGGFRGKDGWFNEREEKIMVNRVLRDDPSKGGMHNRQAITLKMLWEALCDYDMWPIYLLGLTWMIPNSPATSYITLQLKSLGFGTFETNLLTIPAYVVFIINLLVWTWLSERFHQRLILGVGSMIWCLVLLIALETLPDNASHWARWIINVLLIGAPYVHAIVVAMTSRNAGTVRTRTVASAVYNMMVQTSSIISNNIYRENDKPYYRTGNKVLIGLTVWSIFVFIGAKYYYVWRNKKNAEKWDVMSSAEREEYLAASGHLGNKRLDFKFIH
ncbi:major facilitator superfamily domain-containing protein [Aspergillus pseudonomiae]|uniref:Major facilitator superfamily domain-containing protein n=1 Tax=Aspergillus pseudonomiae TaxID=1506151 RepID=A0A5N7CVG6_9EURO|nr:major facilitator superfamily domain-containing protein [Aspergillus pseudonomiae]KAB8258388.1 major facilitator superfamily domain-containing protein [Aspergillus pseudonomiae]KAE8397618.1 major facilitator superfamily domain-containing protein [Aspergillus pseudonomiae]